MKLTRKSNCRKCHKLQEKYPRYPLIRNPLTKMKGNNACGPDPIPIEVWKKMGEQGIAFLEKELNEVITSGILSS